MNPALPIDEHLPAISAALREQGAAVVIAEPGAGKSTRIPPYLAFADDGGVERSVVCTQPRRIAARLAASFVAKERGVSLGAEVGYEVRHDKKTSKATRLRYMTEGVARLSWDRLASGANTTLILDEFHERKIEVDLLLALASEHRKKRDDFQLIVMSATLYAEPLAEFLKAPIIKSRGRQFGVETLYQEARPEESLSIQVRRATREALRSDDDGSVLVFLPGVREINEAERDLKEIPNCPPRFPLHANAAPQDIEGALGRGQGQARKRVILATNIAETSITIPDVTTVIDSGLARIARHSPWTGLPSLRVEKISQASALQRKGRAGRTQAGRCVRLYTEHDIETRRRFDDPEIQRADLSAIWLSLRANTSIDHRALRWFTEPPQAAIASAERLLALLGALDANGNLTSLGAQMAELPTHPRLARLLCGAAQLEVVEEGILAAALISEGALGKAKAKGGRSSRGQRRHEDLERSAESDVQDAIDSYRSIRDVERARKQFSRILQLPASSVDSGEATTQFEREARLRHALLWSFPDRVFARTESNKPALRSSAGTIMQQAGESVVRDAEFLIAVEVEERDGDRRPGGKVLCASAVDADWLLDHPDLQEVDEHFFDSESRRVLRKTGLSLDKLVIDEELISDPKRLDAEKTRRCMSDWLLDGGYREFVSHDEWERYRRRFSFAKESSSIDADSWPQCELADLVGALLNSVSLPCSRKQLLGCQPINSFHYSLPPEIRSQIETCAPEAISIPGRKRVPIHYEVDRPPWIESRLQDFFGLVQAPRIGNTALTLHLLAPNRRAVQVTSDLSGFWANHYPTLRKQLMRRYPKHAWPEDPTQK